MTGWSIAEIDSLSPKDYARVSRAVVRSNAVNEAAMYRAVSFAQSGRDARVWYEQWLNERMGNVDDSVEEEGAQSGGSWMKFLHDALNDDTVPEE